MPHVGVLMFYGYHHEMLILDIECVSYLGNNLNIEVKRNISFCRYVLESKVFLKHFSSLYELEETVNFHKTPFVPCFLTVNLSRVNL